MADESPTHVKIRNRKTGGVWECPAGVLDEYLADGWQKAAESAELTNDGAVPSDKKAN